METELKPVAVGDHVIVVDTTGRRNHALVTAVWGTFGTVRDIIQDWIDRMAIYKGKTVEEVQAGSSYKDVDLDSPAPAPSLNTIIVDPDESKSDSYGRQINRNYTSVPHQSNQPAHGNYWMNA